MSDYEKTYERWNDAVQKFDYYVVSVIGAGLVVLLRDLKVDCLGVNSNTVRAVGVFFLLISFVAGLLRMERQHMLLRFENEKVRTAGYRERLRTGATEVFRESDNQAMSAAETAAFASRVEVRFADLQGALKKTGDRMALAYSIRNWTLLIGLVVLFAATFVDPVMKTAISTSPAAHSSHQP